jgi:fatty-acyl-CoA synthase
LLRAAAAELGDRVYLHCASERASEEEVTFQQLQRRARQVAAGLLARGIDAGDRVAVAAANQAEWLELFFGATWIGAVVVTLNVRYRASELEYMLNQAGVRLVLSTAKTDTVDFEAFYPAFRFRVPTVEHVLFLGGSGAGEKYAELLVEPADDAELDRRADQVRPADPAAILYTSGTTGRPKGAVLTHASMISAATAQVHRQDMGPDDVVFSAVPLNHVGGLTCGVITSLLARSRVVMPPAFSPATALDAIERHRATIVGGVPTMFALELGHESFPARDTSTVRLTLVGAANADPTLCAAIGKGFPHARLFNVYGLSETSGACVMSAPDDDLDTIARTLGTPLDGVEVRIVNPDGVDVEPGAEGELLVRGPGTMARYWELPDATAEALLPDGWLATGDIVAADLDGYLSIRGRRKEMYIQGGYNVYPIEVENVLTEHPAVAMAAGIGVPHRVLGEVGCYYLQLRPGHQVDAAEITAFCAERLADYKVPKQVEFVAELPLTGSGKVAKALLRERFHRTGA